MAFLCWLVSQRQTGVGFPSKQLGCFVVLFSPLWKRIVMTSPSMRPWGTSHTEETCCCGRCQKRQQAQLECSWKPWQQVNTVPVCRRISGLWLGRSQTHVGTQDVVNISEMSDSNSWLKWKKKKVFSSGRFLRQGGVCWACGVCLERRLVRLELD